uniref:Lipoprotein n=1 Tax=Burkholderia phage vB_BgluM-SURPRISE13 TaxID=3159457 RepID=A0AAU7PGE5_9VIRU
MKTNLKLAAVFTLAFALAACGGGGGGSNDASNPNDHGDQPQVVTRGTAAIGAPIIGATVTFKCVTGDSHTAQTDANGLYTATLSQDDYPCAIQVAGGQANGQALSQALYSVAPAPGTSNITPLTDAMVGAMAGQAPADFFNGATSGSLSGSITADKLSASLAKVAAAIQTLPGQLKLADGFNPINSTFGAVKGDANDALLDQYATSLKAAGLTQNDVTAKVATADTTLTKQAFSAIAFTTPNLTSFNIGSSINLDNTFGIAITDPNRGSLSAKANIDANGNVTSFTDAGSFTGVISTLGNRVGMLCASNNGTSQGQYVFASTDLTEVTDATELAGKQFDEYQDCSKKDVATWDGAGNVQYSNGESDSAMFPAFQSAGKPVDGAVVHYKAYKGTVNGQLTYVYLLVSNQLGNNAALIDGNNNYVMVGVQRFPS